MNVTGPREIRLPRLRANLQIVRAAPTPDGMPTWTIGDPVRNRYFQVGWVAFQLLERWPCGSADRLIQTVNDETTCRVTNQDVQDLIKFLFTNNLTEEPPTGSSRDYVAQAEAGWQHWGAWLVHHYLFFRVPLVRPDRFLQATLPLVSPFFTKTAAWIVILLGMTGLYLVSRQWDTFVSTFLSFFNFHGLVFYAVALAVVKILHELGHAYTATRYGCRVPTMGVAFIVLFPVLYSDTTEAWRLTSRRERLWIAAAGVMTELALAMLSTFVWNFLPNGTARGVAFVVATTSWVVGLSINVNPLMRFDGYYLLSDWMGVPNLQERAFAFGRWKLRELLFALGAAPPEPLSPALRMKLILYAWATWLYRFFLFLAIALLVYYFFFKVLGLVLFAVEILWFIVLPIARELKAWWLARATLAQTSRFWVTLLGLAAVLTLAFIPWPTRVSLPAVVQALPYATLYTPAPGRIRDIAFREGQRVREGEVLLTVEAPVIDKDLRLTKTQIEALELRARRQAANRIDRTDNYIVAEALKTRLTQLKGLMEKRENLVLKAPMTGVITDRAESLHPGRWINEKLALAYLVDPGMAQIEALALEKDLAYLEPGQDARFIPDDLTRPSVPARVREVGEIDESAFTVPYLASIYGGDIPVRKDERGRLQPETSIYRVRLEILGPPPGWNQAVTGQLHIEGHRWSMVRRAWDRVLAVLIRESGF